MQLRVRVVDRARRTRRAAPPRSRRRARASPAPPRPSGAACRSSAPSHPPSGRPREPPPSKRGTQGPTRSVARHLCRHVCRTRAESCRRHPEGAVLRLAARSPARPRGGSDGRGSSSANTFTRSSGCDVGGTSERSSSDTFETASRIASSCAAEPLDLLLGQREPRELRDVEHLFSRDRHLREILPKEEGPVRGPSTFGSERKALGGLDVRGLGALGALDDLELHALALRSATCSPPS